MEGTVTTLIILILGAALAVTIYLLFKGSPSFPAVKKNSADDPDISEGKDTGKASEQYKLIYTRDDAFETKGIEELIATISDVNNPKVCARSCIYYDEELCRRYISIGRDKSNTYTLGASNIDRYNAVCIAKVGNEYRVKAGPDSRNGLSYEFKGERITSTISFYDSVCLYMGNVRIDLSVPGYEAAYSARSRNDIFSDLRDTGTCTDTAKTRTWNRRT